MRLLDMARPGKPLTLLFRACDITHKKMAALQALCGVGA
jgi:hypothetical protein